MTDPNPRPAGVPSVSAAPATPSRVGRVVQVNVSPGGVPKLPVPVALVGPLGLEGDDHHDRTEHGGPFRAVCLYSVEAIGRVRAEGHPIGPGSAGENLTLQGIELSTLAAGHRLAVGDTLVLEITKPVTPCQTIRGSFADGRIARISVKTHPLDSRLYARVLVPGVVRPGDEVRVLPALPDTDAPIHALLDRLDANERANMLANWRAAQAGGVDVRILDDGELAAAATPRVPDSNFNTALGLRALPHLQPEVLAFFAANTSVAWIDTATVPWPGAVPESAGAVLAGDPDPVAVALERHDARPSLARIAVRRLDENEALAWERTTIAGFGFTGTLADAWLACAPAIARDPRMHLFLAEIDGEPAGAAGLFVHRDVGALGPGSVVPAFRGRGVHAALIAARLHLGMELGCDLLAGWARQDSQSERNMTRLGLRRIWTRHTYRWTPGADGASAPASFTGDAIAAAGSGTPTAEAGAATEAAIGGAPRG